jgi:hypothetical protein
VTGSAFKPWATVRPSYQPAIRWIANPTWDAGTTSAHVAIVELTHLPPEGRADAAAADVA